MKEKKLKRVVIKEELVALTGNFKLAVILQQMIYWSERVKDFDKFLIEENSRKEKDGQPKQDLTKGWIYKSAEELADETMLMLSPETVRRHLDTLVSKGYLKRRTNPKYKWDRTFQYRVDINYISEELENIGYNLHGYAFHKTRNRTHKTRNRTHKTRNRDTESVGAIPEITTEITTENTTDIYIDKKISESEELDSLINSYKLNDEVVKTFKEYLKMRKKEKYTTTPYAIELLLDKLINITTEPEEQKKLLESAILGSWKSIYEPNNKYNKSDDTTTKTKYLDESDYLDERDYTNEEYTELENKLLGWN